MNEQMLRMFNMLRNSNNPMGMLQQMYGNDPIFSQAMRMAQGKSPQELQQIVRNVAHEKGMSDNDLNSFISQFGLRF